MIFSFNSQLSVFLIVYKLLSDWKLTLMVQKNNLRFCHLIIDQKKNSIVLKNFCTQNRVGPFFIASKSFIIFVLLITEYFFATNYISFNHL